MGVNTTDAKGLTFECQPGCGFCCPGTAASVHTASWVLRTHLAEERKAHAPVGEVVVAWA